jgi:hypothetical protein
VLPLKKFISKKQSSLFCLYARDTFVPDKFHLLFASKATYKVGHLMATASLATFIFIDKNALAYYNFGAVGLVRHRLARHPI